DPARAQRIANGLAAAFIDENSKTREERAQQTSVFIASQLSASQARLGELEARLRRAKESHIGQLPEQTQSNLLALGGLRQQIDANTAATRGEQDRLAMIDHQIAALSQGARDAATAPRTGAAAADAVLSPDARVLALQRELE